MANYKDRFNAAMAKMPVVGILRDIPAGQEEACAQTAAACGLTAIEVTMNTANAAHIITKLKAVANPLGIIVGAGTIRTITDLENASDAGAEFIVSPTTFEKIIHRGVGLGLPMIPGALTPTEVETAYQAGATCVKIFPAGAVGGPSYIKDLRGPFRDIPLLACGGVNPENAGAYIKAGANVLAFGGSIFHKDLMASGNWEEIGKRLLILLDAVRAARK